MGLLFSVGYIEIYKEKIYDLLNDRARIEFASDTISNKEFFVDCVEKTVDIFINGSYKRKSSTKDPQQLSSLSHAIFRIVRTQLFDQQLFVFIKNKIIFPIRRSNQRTKRMGRFI